MLKSYQYLNFLITSKQVNHLPRSSSKTTALSLPSLHVVASSIIPNNPVPTAVLKMTEYGLSGRDVCYLSCYLSWPLNKGCAVGSGDQSLKVLHEIITTKFTYSSDSILGEKTNSYRKFISSFIKFSHRNNFYKPTITQNLKEKKKQKEIMNDSSIHPDYCLKFVKEKVNI